MITLTFATADRVFAGKNLEKNKDIFIFPISKDNYDEIKKNLRLKDGYLYKKLTRDDILLFGSTANLPEDLLKSILPRESMWIPSGMDFKTGTVQVEEDEQGKPVHHQISETSNACKMFQYYLSMIGYPDYCMITTKWNKELLN